MFCFYLIVFLICLFFAFVFSFISGLFLFCFVSVLFCNFFEMEPTSMDAYVQNGTHI